MSIRSFFSTIPQTKPTRNISITPEHSTWSDRRTEQKRSPCTCRVAIFNSCSPMPMLLPHSGSRRWQIIPRSEPDIVSIWAMRWASSSVCVCRIPEGWVADLGHSPGWKGGGG
ncbi:hypothetical protein CEXT_592311 [Caerostris extrusa]|uniref:Uncharacterized protein n=1 Tax=Caerostris extrusa TaxID=172846 RepID=A0AAV4XWK0_CAEEX|nr:hypothetical protein CEXT_592311 [Caerostris extrusa]